MKEPDRRRHIGRAFGVMLALVALAAASVWAWAPLAGAQTAEPPPPVTIEPPPPPPPPPTVQPPPPPPPADPTGSTSTPPGGTQDGGWSASSVPSWDPDQIDRDDPLERWRDWTPTPGSYDTSYLDAFAERMRAKGWGEGRIRREIYAPFIVVGPATWSDSWGALRMVAGPRPHHGQDVLCTYGAPVLATQEGTVTWSTSSLGGLAAYLHLGDGSFYYYAHLSGTPQGLPPGTVVSSGDVIGFCGATGNASVPHVHFSYVTAGGVSVDPMDRLRGWLDEAQRRLPDPPPPQPDVVEETVEAADVIVATPPATTYPSWGGVTTASTPESADPPASLATGAAAALGSPATVPAAALLVGVPLLGLLRRRIREPWS